MPFSSFLFKTFSDVSANRYVTPPTKNVDRIDITWFLNNTFMGLLINNIDKAIMATHKNGFNITLNSSGFILKFFLTECMFNIIITNEPRHVPIIAPFMFIVPIGIRTRFEIIFTIAAINP